MAGVALIAQGIERRRHILRFVKKYQARYGCSPTSAEIADELDVAKNAVRHHLDILAREGFVELQPRKHRSLRIINDGRYPR